MSAYVTGTSPALDPLGALKDRRGAALNYRSAASVLSVLLFSAA
jgi:hypothetical protein